MAVHIFHLIEEWRTALEEIRRVLRPGGVMLFGYDWRSDDAIPAQIQDHWFEILPDQARRTVRPGSGKFGRVRDALLEGRAVMDEWEVASWELPFVPEEYLRQTEAGYFSGSWSLTDEERSYYMVELRRWAEERFAPLDQQYMVTRKFIWQRFRWQA